MQQQANPMEIVEITDAIEKVVQAGRGANKKGRN